MNSRSLVYLLFNVLFGVFTGFAAGNMDPAKPNGFWLSVFL